ncbi:hypothetical protein RHGRI_017589 [Rhododendron griersonianum]|uniref:Uncharacterized protein n=1 Tax=Rhododendron griersonianum TaxID=479676 RepID=A0AAV6JYG6_9ERIC|nr:hypothetical protein RHGRI_017589 [Rhododendron griersonianum]
MAMPASFSLLVSLTFFTTTSHFSRTFSHPHLHQLRSSIRQSTIPAAAKKACQRLHLSLWPWLCPPLSLSSSPSPSLPSHPTSHAHSPIPTSTNYAPPLDNPLVPPRRKYGNEEESNTGYIGPNPNFLFEKLLP